MCLTVTKTLPNETPIPCTKKSPKRTFCKTPCHVELNKSNFGTQNFVPKSQSPQIPQRSHIGRFSMFNTNGNPTQITKSTNPHKCYLTIQNPRYFHHFPQLTSNLNNLRRDPIVQCPSNMCSGNHTSNQSQRNPFFGHSSHRNNIKHFLKRLPISNPYNLFFRNKKRRNAFPKMQTQFKNSFA